VPNFVDLGTGGWGEAIQGPLNSSQTPTMANFATLADVLAGCATRAANDACGKLFAAATPPTGAAPTDMLTAAQAIAPSSGPHDPACLTRGTDRLNQARGVVPSVPNSCPYRPTRRVLGRVGWITR